MVDLNQLKYFVIDVDGTMTDSGIYYDDNGNEYKKFSTRDGEGIKLAKAIGFVFIVITGRKYLGTERRMKELNIDHFEQGVQDKYSYLLDYMLKNNISKNELAYIGDDINDLKAMSLAGFICCPSDSCIDVKNASNYCSTVNGGNGVVRDVIEYILRNRNQWDLVINQVYGIKK